MPAACRTDSSYAHWEEALKTWNEVRSLSKDLARQVSAQGKPSCVACTVGTVCMVWGGTPGIQAVGGWLCRSARVARGLE